MEKCVMALGTFDGVHLGHRHVVGAAADIARTAGMPLTVFTFSDHPRQALGRPVGLLSTLAEKTALLREAGADRVVKVPFEQVRHLSPEEFIWFTAGYYGAEHYVCGEDYRFGLDGAGDAEALQKICARCGKRATVVEFLRDEKGEKVSSRHIRALIAAGECEQVRRTLGRYYALEGAVVHGKGFARRWGTPTINQRLPAEMEKPRYGVYATRAEVDGKRYKAVTNVGMRPTFDDGKTPNMETYILDAQFETIGRARIEFVRFLRPECRFDDTESLQMQIAKDVRVARECVIIE